MKIRLNTLAALLLAPIVGLTGGIGAGRPLHATEVTAEMSSKPGQDDCAVALHIHHALTDRAEGPAASAVIQTSLDLVKSVVNGPPYLPVAAALLGPAPTRDPHALSYGLQLVFHGQCDQRMDMSLSLVETLRRGHDGPLAVEAIAGRLPLGDRAFPACDAAFWDCSRK